MLSYKEQVVKLLEKVLNDVKNNDVAPIPVGHPEHLWDTLSGFKVNRSDDVYECRIELPTKFYGRLTTEDYI